jgi:hypothetical protein
MESWVLSWENAIQKVDPYEVLKRVLISHHVDIIELNQEQLGKGIKSTGERLAPYSPAYAKIRAKKGLQTANTDFKVKGDFWDGIYANPSKLETIIGSRDFKEKFLEKRDGKDVFSLTPESIEKLLWERGVADDFITEYTNALIAA